MSTYDEMQARTEKVLQSDGTAVRLVTDLLLPLLEKAFPTGGTHVNTGTGARTSLTGVYLLTVDAEANFSVFTCADCTVPTGTAIAAGTKIYSDAGITAYTLASGQVSEYRR
jgi:hypothetical protein